MVSNVLPELKTKIVQISFVILELQEIVVDLEARLAIGEENIQGNSIRHNFPESYEIPFGL